MSNWILVEDRLPELGVTVLGWNSDGLRVVNCDIRYGGNGYVWSSECRDACSCCDFFDENITHWIPMIDGPVNKKEKKDEQLDLS